MILCYFNNAFVVLNSKFCFISQLSLWSFSAFLLSIFFFLNKQFNWYCLYIYIAMYALNFVYVFICWIIIIYLVILSSFLLKRLSLHYLLMWWIRIKYLYCHFSQKGLINKMNNSLTMDYKPFQCSKIFEIGNIKKEL